MTYRDNDVYFYGIPGYQLISGSYTISSFSITNGQDPDHHIYAGLTATCGNDGRMVFSVGRKGSGSVADWLNARVPGWRTTFNHSAGELNFAFIGTLRLTLTGGILGNGQDTFTFLNVALAQGHSGTSNNWWFGGLNCSYADSDRVIATGTRSVGTNVTFDFRRGGNGVNAVDFNLINLIDTANWMSNINDGIRLDSIMMPGSHDAGMSELHHCAPPIGIDGLTKTQGGSVGQQLIDGSRYFDIRVDYDYDALVTYHRTGAGGCNGQDLSAVLDQTQTFLEAHPTETAILKFSHIRDYDGHSPLETIQRINDLLFNYDSVIYKNQSASINLAEVVIGDTRGKMILVFDYDLYIDPTTGRFRYKDGGSIQPGANITVYDEYSNTSNYDTMRANQLQKWDAQGGLGSGYFFLLSWTLTGGFGTPSVENMAAEANSKLPGVLYDRIIAAQTSKPNIVYLDFINSTVTQSVILYNF